MTLETLANIKNPAGAAEAFLLAVFLSRYATYRAKRGQFAAMNGAARLYAEIRASTR